MTERLSELAQGSAIWVKLTAQLIQKGKIHATGPMKVFLADIPAPAALSQLYAKLFAHETGDDPAIEQLAAGALEILAVARRPLTILEFGWAVALNDRCGMIRTVEKLKDSVDERKVLTLLQPFLLQVDFEDVKKRQVRLVHESLRDLILQYVPSDWGRSHNTARESMADNNRIEQRQPKLEASLSRLCVEYLLFDDFDQKALFSEEQETIQTLEELPGFASFNGSDDACEQVDSCGASQGFGNEEVFYYDPAERGFGEFYVYASCFWLDHFQVSAPENLPDTSDIVKLCRASSTRLQNWIGQNCRPDCTITPKFGYDHHSQDPLTVVSLHGPKLALKRLLEDDKIDLSSKEFLLDSVKQTIKQIIQLGDVSRLSLLLRDTRVGPEIRNIGIFHQVMTQWASSRKKLRPWASCFDLVFDICDDVLVQGKWGNELLCLAVSCGCLPMVERLFEEAARKPLMRDELLRDVRRDIKPPDYHQSIGEAVWYNHVEVLRYLLQQEGIEVHLRHHDSEGYNVLHKAARWCNPEVVSLLISHFPEGVNQSNKNGDTPLHLVVFGTHAICGRLESAKVLLTQGHADVKGGCVDELSSFGEPLRMAARYGDVAMCRVLVEDGGADPRRVLRIENGHPTLMDPVDFEELAPKVLDVLCSLGGMTRG